MLNLKDIPKVARDLSNLKFGLSLKDLQSKPHKVDVFSYIDNKFIEINDCYVIDLESYHLNSKIRMIQLYDVADKRVYVFVNGNILYQQSIEKELKKHKISVMFNIYSEEESMFIDFIDFLKDNPKAIIGHNFAHFDIGLIGSLIQHYKIKGFKIHEYTIGNAQGKKRVAFSYSITKEEKPSIKWWDDKERYNIIDTLLIAQSLQLNDISLKALTKNKEFQKLDVHYSVFENDLLESEWVLYGIYDVLSIPSVLEDLRNMWNGAINNLKIQFKQSQRTSEHVLMKQAGAIAESYLNNLLGYVSIESKDHLSKYFGGITRAWDTNLFVSNGNKVIRNLDFTSFYPFSCLKQNIFDVLDGKCIRYSDVKYNQVKKHYDKLLYSSIFEIKAKEKTTVVIEGELQKNNKEYLGVGYFRSFDKDKRIAELEHQLCYVVLKRGESIKLTKSELEITKAIFKNSNFFITKLIDGIIPTDDKKSKEYIKLFSLKKNKNNPAKDGYKILLNASYGKLAESKGRYFNLACASAITGYCRATLIKTIIQAVNNKVKVIYSDTDSLYVYGYPSHIKKIQDYSNKLNDDPLKYGEDNLKDEGEDIRAFWCIKRKRYLKIVNKNGKNIVIVKGENGNSDIRWRDVYFRLSCITNGTTSTKDISNKIQNEEFELKAPLHNDFESSCKNLYHHYLNKPLSYLLPVKSKAIITMMLNVHFRNSTSYEDGIYYHHIVKAWENKTERKAYVGCFFQINRDYSFKPKQSDEIKSWAIEYSSYLSKNDEIPVIYASQYNNIINREINLDTIRIKTREGIDIKALKKDKDKTSITFKVMSLPRTSQTTRALDIFGNCYVFRLKIPENLDHNEVEFLGTNNKQVYSNATLFLTGQYRIESAIRINKSKMFIKKRDVFSIYRFVSDLGVFTQKLLLKTFNQVTTTKTGKVFQPVILNSFPRFTFVTQADIYQPVSREYAQKVHNASFDSTFHNAHLNHFWNFKLLKYCELNVYDKKHSASRKIEHFKMMEFEKNTFQDEFNEGEYRSEIKFKLKRNLYETLSYIFTLSNINQEYFLDVISKNNAKQFKHSRKHYVFEFSTIVKGYFEFNQRKCIILFIILGRLDGKIIFLSQVYSTNHDTHLESAWETYVSIPPNNKKSVVRWLWEEDKMVNKEEIEDLELEIMGFK